MEAAEPGSRLSEGDGWRLTHTAKCLFGARVYSKNPSPAVSAWGQKDCTSLVTDSWAVRTHWIQALCCLSVWDHICYSSIIPLYLKLAFLIKLSDQWDANTGATHIQTGKIWITWIIVISLTEIHRWYKIKVQSDTSVKSVMFYIFLGGITE